MPPQITHAKRGTGFSLFKGWFTEITQYFVTLVYAYIEGIWKL